MWIPFYQIIKVINVMQIKGASIKLLYIITIIVCFSSCNGNKVNPLAFIPPDLSRAEDANVIEITKIEKEVVHYYGLSVNDNFIVTTGSDYEFTQHIFSKRTGEYLKSFAAIGRGPGEFVMGGTSVYFTTGNDSTYYIVHLPLSTVYTYKTKDIMSQSLPSRFTRLAPIPAKFVGQKHFDAIVPIKDRIITIPANMRKHKYLLGLYNLDGLLLDTFDVYPQVDEIKDKRVIYEEMFNNAAIGVRPDAKKMVVGTIYGAYMGIYSLENDSISLLKENRYHVPQFYIELYEDPRAYTIHSKDDDVTGFTSMATSQDRIYALYYGRKFSRKDQLYYILEYDWSGNLIKSYKFDQEVFDINYDSLENRLYLLYGAYDENDFRLGYMEV